MQKAECGTENPARRAPMKEQGETGKRKGRMRGETRSEPGNRKGGDARRDPSAPVGVTEAGKSMRKAERKDARRDPFDSPSIRYTHSGSLRVTARQGGAKAARGKKNYSAVHGVVERVLRHRGGARRSAPHFRGGMRKPEIRMTNETRRTKLEARYGVPAGHGEKEKRGSRDGTECGGDV